MNDEEKKPLIKSLKKAEETNYKSSLDDNPIAKRELLIGQLRNIKALLKLAKRKGAFDEELDKKLDEYNERRQKYLKEIEEAGFDYVEGEEDEEIYKKFEL